MRRLLDCVRAWPECFPGEYNPQCCRFPKSCSCTSYSDHVTEDALEPATEHYHYMIVCEIHKRIIEQCNHTSANKKRTDVPCPGGCWR